MRRIAFYISFVLGLCNIGVRYIILKTIKKNQTDEQKREYSNKSIKKLADIVLTGINMDVEIYGKENIPKDEGYLLISNHQSNVDIVALEYALDEIVPFIAKQELAKIPVLKQWILEMGGYFLNRDNPREGMKVILDASQDVANGKPIGVFPEGTRSKTGEIDEFKKGTFKIATKSKCKIVPVAVIDTNKGLENPAKGLSKIKAKVVFGEAVDVSKLTREEERSLHTDMRNYVHKLHEQYKG